MPSVTRLESREQEIMAKLRNRPRLEGEHLTDRISCNRKVWAMARLAMQGKPVPFSDATLLRFERGNLRGAWLEEGEMSQIQAITTDDESVGTIDVWRGFVVEIKSSEFSTRRDPQDADHWMLQVAGYTYRTIRPEAKSAKAELWIVHERGDHGVKFCPDHGVPERKIRRKYEETGGQRAICPDCLDETGEIVWLHDGNRDPELRCWELHWTRKELESIHRNLTWRGKALREDIANRDLTFSNTPEIRYGYSFECPSCPVKEMISCPGMGGDDELEEQMTGSIVALEQQKEEAKV